MYIVSIELQPGELNFIRQALDLVTVKGTDAKFLASLQIKFETELAEVQKMMEQEEVSKQEGLKKIMATESSKSTTKTK
jgi:Tfp pilus assembly protein PilN